MTPEEWAAVREQAAEAQREIDRFQVANIGARLEADRVMRAIFAEAIAGLDEDLRRRAEEAYERRAVPDFFGDSRSAAHFFDRALRNRALTAETRAVIEAIAAEYRKEMAALAVRFGDHRRAPIDPGATMRKSDGIRAGFEQAILFDRDELSARTVARLRRALSAEERAQVAGLDDYERRNETPRR